MGTERGDSPVAEEPNLAMSGIIGSLHFSVVYPSSRIRRVD